ncbi:MAG: hypothetical protein KIH10_16895 [Candidatus Freyarchaeota archaeon]|nr:hypothetical protein [Candidatus Jordarchaeia archaeon]MBS7281615.1 hypothetical protein [Candidatus Jordarchaeia archaeon]
MPAFNKDLLRLSGFEPEDLTPYDITSYEKSPQSIIMDFVMEKRKTNSWNSLPTEIQNILSNLPEDQRNTLLAWILQNNPVESEE